MWPSENQRNWILDLQIELLDTTIIIGIEIWPIFLHEKQLSLTLKSPGGWGGGMCPQHFLRLAVLRAMELGVSNLHVNSFFHV